MIYNNLPGVYSTINVESTYVKSKNKSVFIIGYPNKSLSSYIIRKVDNMSKCISLYGEDMADSYDNISTIYRMFSEIGIKDIYVLPINRTQSDTQIKTQLEALKTYAEDIDIAVCCIDMNIDCKYFGDVIKTRNANGKRTIGIATSSEYNATDHIAAAEHINSERVILLAQKFTKNYSTVTIDTNLGPALIAKLIFENSDPAKPFDFTVVSGQFEDINNIYLDSDLDNMIGSGLTVFKKVNGTVQLIRLVTTRTLDDEDMREHSFLDLNTTLIIDDINDSIDDMIKNKFHRAKNNASTRASIISQTAILLDNKKGLEYIDDYKTPSITVDMSDPTRCILNTSYSVMMGLHSIVVNNNIKI